MNVYPVSAIKQFEQAWCERRRQSTMDLIREVAKACVLAMHHESLVHDNQSVVVVCGVGNNGVDGLFIAKHLAVYEHRVRVFIVNCPASWSVHTKQALLELEAAHVCVEWIEPNLELVTQAIQEADVVVDALFGMGFSRPIQGHLATLITTMNESKSTIVSVDLPSGLLPESGFVKLLSVVADHTLVVGAYKLGHVLFDGLDVCGKQHFIDVQLDEKLEDAIKYTEASKLLMTHNKRKRNVHKYTFGHVLVVGGSPSMMGCVELASLAALRSGAGLVSVAIDQKNIQNIRPFAPELITPSYNDSVSLNNLLMKKTSIVYGMGLTKAIQPEYVLFSLLQSEAPLVIDGDGLTHFHPYATTPRNNRVLVCTPHLQELSYLVGSPIEQVKNNPLLYAKTFAQKANCIVVVKGPTTMVVDAINTEIMEVGHAGLATAGTGDVLAGVLGAYLGLMRDPYEAVKQALIVFSNAAACTKKHRKEQGMIASDVIDALFMNE